MIANETTRLRKFTLEVSEKELEILVSLVGYCSASALGVSYDDQTGKLLANMYHVMQNALGTGEDFRPKYKLSISKND